MSYIEKKLRERLEAGEGGFTLIELLVVMLIIGILLAIAIPTFLSVVNNAHNTSVESNLGNAVIEANANYTQDNSQFGQSAGSLVSELNAGETSFKYAALTSTAQGAQNTVYVAPFACYTTAGTFDTTFPAASSDNNCQAVMLTGYSPQTNVCYAVAVIKAALSSGITAMGNTFQNPGTFYAAITPPSGTNGCDTALTGSNWQQNGFPPAG